MNLFPETWTPSASWAAQGGEELKNHVPEADVFLPVKAFW